MHNDGVIGVAVAMLEERNRRWLVPLEMTDACHLGDVVMDRCHLPNPDLKLFLGCILALLIEPLGGSFVMESFQVTYRINKLTV